MRPPRASNRPRSAAALPGRPRAFTLVEILVVVAILVILLALVVGIGSWAVENARERDTGTLLSILDTAAEQFKDQSARSLGRYRTSVRTNRTSELKKLSDGVPDCTRRKAKCRIPLSVLQTPRLPLYPKIVWG